MNSSREHVISLVLSDEDWRAFVQVHPQPVVWLRERIQETIATARRDQASVPAERAVVEC